MTPRRRPAEAARAAEATPEPHRSRRLGRRRRTRARRVKRIVRHVDPWSVLKISVLFYLAVFLMVCVASTLLWRTARNAGTIDQVEDFVTSLGFGNCQPVDQPDAAAGDPSTSTSLPVEAPADPAATTLAPSAAEPDADDSDGDDCPAGQELVGEFQFEDDRIFEAAVLGGLILVVAGSAFNAILALLFNLISDLTGGVRFTVLEPETPPRPGGPRPPDRAGSPPSRASR
ncbi:MAG: DUF3566 domain-containing protein [Acidimicrobiia bacterium]